MTTGILYSGELITPIAKVADTLNVSPIFTNFQNPDIFNKQVDAGLETNLLFTEESKMESLNTNKIKGLDVRNVFDEMMIKLIGKD